MTELVQSMHCGRPLERPGGLHLNALHRKSRYLAKWLQTYDPFCVTNNFIAPFFIIQSELSDGQRERWTSESQSKGILIHLHDLETIKIHSAEVL